jgi:hypothetical protein
MALIDVSTRSFKMKEGKRRREKNGRPTGEPNRKGKGQTRPTNSLLSRNDRDPFGNASDKN